MTGQAIRKWIPALAAVLVLAHPAGAQEHSEEYREGYNDGVRDAICTLLKSVSPLLPIVAPELVAGDPEIGTQEVAIIAAECEIEWVPAEPTVAPAPKPEPENAVRCRNLATLIKPLDAQIDRLLARPYNDMTAWELRKVRLSRSEIAGEMRRAGCHLNE